MCPSESNQLLVLSSAKIPVANNNDDAAQIIAKIRHSKLFTGQRPPLVSRRKSVTALAMFFIIRDSDPRRSTPCRVPSDAAEIMSPRQTSVEGFPSTVTGHSWYNVRAT